MPIQHRKLPDKKGPENSGPRERKGGRARLSTAKIDELLKNDARKNGIEISAEANTGQLLAHILISEAVRKGLQLNVESLRTEAENFLIQRFLSGDVKLETARSGAERILREEFDPIIGELKERAMQNPRRSRDEK